MSSVTPKYIQQLSQLAQLKLTEQQIKQFQKQFDQIVDYMHELSQLDLQTVAETSRVLDQENIFREDVVTPSLTQTEALANAKKTHQGYVVVPLVLQKDSG